jgi:hypothetical protein
MIGVGLSTAGFCADKGIVAEHVHQFSFSAGSAAGEAFHLYFL